MSIKSLKPTKPASPKERRMTLAIEPRVAELIRQVVRHEHALLSEFLEQALIAWIRRWRPEWQLEVEGPEGPAARTKLLIVATDETDLRRVPRRPLGRSRRITEDEVVSTEGYTINPSRQPKAAKKPAKKRARTGARRGRPIIAVS